MYEEITDMLKKNRGDVEKVTAYTGGPLIVRFGGYTEHDHGVKLNKRNIAAVIENIERITRTKTSTGFITSCDDTYRLIETVFGRKKKRTLKGTSYKIGDERIFSFYPFTSKCESCGDRYDNIMPHSLLVFHKDTKTTRDFVKVITKIDAKDVGKITGSITPEEIKEILGCGTVDAAHAAPPPAVVAPEKNPLTVEKERDIVTIPPAELEPGKVYETLLRNIRVAVQKLPDGKICVKLA